MTDFRALCEELNGLLEYISDISPHLCEDEINNLTNSARAALAEQPVGPTDEELREMWFGSKWFNEGATLREFISIARAVLARWGQPAATPIPVAERLPGLEDCIQRGNDHWCWGQERSLITGWAAARWRLMRVSSLEDEAVGWLPANALPVPSND
jgi:hypothetical protein